MAEPLDYRALGFKCGLEIHQQVATRKLFCSCRTDAPELDDERPHHRFVRRLRPTQSELGEVDAAALAEAGRDRTFEYRGHPPYSCLVEADEEPPHPIGEETLDVALTMALLLGARPVDELQWMRKIVIDGSNTSGFQRTGLVALGGSVDGVAIQTICLEEDSARRIGEKGSITVWGLDRLGIPLIEIATDPTIKDGGHAREVAARLGALLRSTGRVKRGLGTIRQDLNVSIAAGTRVEVKGVQELNAIPHVTDWEVRRQLRLAEVRTELGRRGATVESYAWAPRDLSDVFAKTQAKFVAATLAKGGKVLGHRLVGMHGLLGAARKEDPRLGKELAQYARRDGGVQGILHGDELPGMGVSDPDVAEVRRRLGCAAHDSFVLVAAEPARAESALRIVVGRARRALEGTVPEVRMAEPDYTTSYLRPMPGRARMYPETDIPPAPVTAERLARLRASLPPPPERVVARLVAAHGVSADEASQIVADGRVVDFEALAAAGEARLAARTLLSYLPELERQHPAATPKLLPWAKEALGAVKAGRFAKEGVPNVLAALAEGKARTVEAAVAAAGLGAAGRSEVEARARALVQERADLVRQRGAASAGPLMGELMKEFRGRVDGRVISEVLEREIACVAAPNGKSA